MTAQIPALNGSPSTTLHLSQNLEITEISGDVEAVLKRHSLDLWRKTVDRAFAPDLAEAIAQSAWQVRNGGRDPIIASDGGSDELMLLGRPGLKPESGDCNVQFFRLEAGAEWLEQAEVENRADGLTDRDAFLDRAAMAMTDGGAAMTMVEVQGGLDAAADAELSRVVQEQALKRGARETSRLGNASYGILHGSETDEAELFDAISTDARARGAVKDTAALGAERIDGDGSGISPDQIRATLAFSTGGFRERLGSGLRKIGLSARHDEARTQTARLVAAARQAIKRGDMVVESRPVLSLKRSAVAMREVRNFPVVDGKPVEPDVIAALSDAPGFLADMEVANVTKALEQQIEWKIWRAVSLRVMVSVRAEILEDSKVKDQISRMVDRKKVNPAKVLLRPYRALSGDLSGRGDGLIDRFAGENWRLAVPDFFAFIKGENGFAEETLGKRDPSGYIEVDCDRLAELASQKDGEFLIRSLVRTWREKGTEIIATAANRADHLAFLDQMEVRYAKGMKVGDWSIG